jgi:DNA-binding MarR family transcriptional regulator
VRAHARNRYAARVSATDTEAEGPAGPAPAVTTDEAGLQAWRAMLLAYAAARRAIETDLSHAGHIPLTWYDVLSELNAAPGGRLRIAELGERVARSRSRISRLIDAMAAVGLATKTQDPGDKRVTWAAITDLGVQAVLATAPTYLHGVEKHFSRHLSADQKTVLTGALTRVREAHSAISATS